MANISVIIEVLFNTMKTFGYVSYPKHTISGYRGSDRWAKIQFGSITIDIGCFEEYDDEYCINVYPWYGKMPNGFFSDTYHHDTGITTHMAGIEEMKEAITSLCENLLSTKMQLESRLDAEKMQVFSEHPTFYIRKKDEYAIFFDGETRKPFWETTKIVKIHKEGNGYWFIQTANTKYQMVFA